MNIFIGFIPPIHFIPPPPVQKHSGPEKISRKHIYTEDKNFLVLLELQLEPYEKRIYKRPVLATGRRQTSGRNYIRINSLHGYIYITNIHKTYKRSIEMT